MRFADPGFAIVKVAGFVLLQGSLAVLVGVSLWAVFVGSQENYEDPLDGIEGTDATDPAQETHAVEREVP